MIRNPSFHRGGDAKRFVNPAEVVVLLLYFTPNPLSLRLAQVRIWLIGVLVLATIGLGAMFFLSFKYFTHQGNDLDWIYDVGGLVVILWLLSAFGVVLCSAMIAIADRGKSTKRLP
jgi:hypothetical protein